MTQRYLSAASGVSLPAIQKIEAGQGNPSLKTLDALLEVLGQELTVSAKMPDWAQLCACGLPLATNAPAARRPTQDLLIKELRRALTLDLSEREREAIAALLWALHDHFSNVFHEHFRRDILTDRLGREENIGRLIKLRRLALSVLATYL